MTTLLKYYIENYFDGVKDYLADKLFVENTPKSEKRAKVAGKDEFYVKLWKK